MYRILLALCTWSVETPSLLCRLCISFMAVNRLADTLRLASNVLC